MAEQFDVVVIGGGPGGYTAAIRAAQLGFKTACIDDWSRTDGKPAPGGTCTNVGCIPSKALLQSSENFEHAGHAFADHGIGVSGLDDRRREDARAQGPGRRAEQRRHPVPVQEEQDRVLPRHRIVRRQGRRLLEARRSPAPSRRSSRPRTSSSPPARSRARCRASPSTTCACSTTKARSRYRTCRSKLGVVGAGVIGLEMGSVWRRLGADVTVLEALPAFLGVVDTAIAKEAQKLFTQAGARRSTPACRSPTSRSARTTWRSPTRTPRASRQT